MRIVEGSVRHPRSLGRKERSRKLRDLGRSGFTFSISLIRLCTRKVVRSDKFAKKKCRISLQTTMVRGANNVAPRLLRCSNSSTYSARMFRTVARGPRGPPGARKRVFESSPAPQPNLSPAPRAQSRSHSPSSSAEIIGAQSSSSEAALAFFFCVAAAFFSALSEALACARPAAATLTLGSITRITSSSTT